MKAILVPSDPGEHMPSVLSAAELLGTRFEGTLEGVALRPIHVEIVAPDPIVAVTFPPADWNDSEFVAKARRTFDTHFAGKQGFRVRWRAGPSIDDAGLGSLARVYDVTVLGKPSSSGAGPRMTTLEGALFESGRPVIIVPPVPITSLGETIVVSWNQSTEQARVTADALPLLKAAGSVTVLTIEGLTVPGPTGAQCCDWLAVHGVNAREVSIGNGGKKPGEVLLSEARKIGADLIVKGAYTQSRLRQMIFGGATSHLLTHSNIPILMAH